jgi:hypothetical protein
MWWRAVCAVAVSVLVTAGTVLADSIPQGNPATGDTGVTPVQSSTFVQFIASAVEILSACIGTIAVGTAIWKGFQLMTAGDSHKHADAMAGLWRWVIGAMVAFGATLLVGLVRGILPAGT